jgi:hypothetical protein
MTKMMQKQDVMIEKQDLLIEKFVDNAAILQKFR